MTVKKLFSSLALSLVSACGGSNEPPNTANDVSEPAPAATPAEAAPELAKSEPAPAAKSEPSASPASTEHHEPAEHSAAAEHATPRYLASEDSENKSQSPINIVSRRAVPGKHQVKFHYQSSKEHVDNLGHTVKVTYDAGSTLDYDGHSYDLLQFHFHTPSEHLIDGVTYPLEMHLVHAEHDHPERLLVVGVLFKEGNANALLESLLANVPEHAGEHADKDEKLNASSVLKRGEGYFHYDGSLTTPPFSETVTWLVVDQAHEASAEQIEALNRIEGNNARHIQAQNTRVVDHWR